MLDVIRNVSLLVFFVILVDVLTLGVSTKWVRGLLKRDAGRD